MLPKIPWFSESAMVRTEALNPTSQAPKPCTQIWVSGFRGLGFRV